MKPKTYRWENRYKYHEICLFICDHTGKVWTEYRSWINIISRIEELTRMGYTAALSEDIDGPTAEFIEKVCQSTRY